MGNMKSSYIENIKTSFPIENRYRSYGMYASSDIKFENLNIERVKSIKIYYPNEMILFPGKKYPLVIMVNGTGVEYAKYEPTLKHLSSWGFIVAGNDDPSTAKGDSVIKTLEFIINLNNSNIIIKKFLLLEDLMIKKTNLTIKFYKLFLTKIILKITSA